MIIHKKNECFILYPENYLDLQFINYIRNAKDVKIEDFDSHDLKNAYYYIKAFNKKKENKMKKGRIIT